MEQPGEGPTAGEGGTVAIETHKTHNTTQHTQVLKSVVSSRRPMSHVSDVLLEEGKIDSSDQSTVLLIVSSSCVGNEVCALSSECGTSLCKFGNRKSQHIFPMV